jgi:ATP-dependent DNA helicase RecQ
MAARIDGREHVWEGGSFDAAHRALCALVGGGAILVGHNLHAFDRVEIAKRAPDSPLLALPTLDTLALSVIAFPKRPYHSLVKDDRLVRDSKPDALSDVRACARVHEEAIAALQELDAREASILGALLHRADVPEHARRGWDALLADLGWPAPEPGPLDLRAPWCDRACHNSPWTRPARVPFALVLVGAWLRAARERDGSVLPGWVRRSQPEAVAMARSLRGADCGDPACALCAEMNSPERWLKAVFGFDGFRATPALPDGTSLQRALVARGLRGESTFGVLPTGGGKSLCFQVPAEARYRRLGQLTVVLSPLQSLMKDQVDALAEGRMPHARALYGGIPSLLRPQIVDEIRSGACGLLYLSPEQLRNASVLKLLKQREIGAIVFDEAHCLSQWGHDFRVDYPYVLRAIGRLCDEDSRPMPPVYLFTATTQADATAQILDHVAEHTGVRPALLDGGAERDNLTYEVRQVPESQRVDVAFDLLAEHLRDGGAGIVFCGSRRRTEEVAQDLERRGIPAAAFHAGMDPEPKRELQEAFLRADVSVITATNAFGMGVDKSDVRIVVHIDMPSSLEAYLQEAGRAGRDRAPATAVLLWAPGDADARFGLGATSDLGPDELKALWRAIERLPVRREAARDVRVVTPKELLFQEAVAGLFDPDAPNEETRVKAGVGWLDRARVLERHENITRVFTGSPKVRSMAEGELKIAALGLTADRRAQWSTVLASVFEAGPEGLSADDIARIAGTLSRRESIGGGDRVLGILGQMVERGLVTAGQTFAAFVRKGIPDTTEQRTGRWNAREERLLGWLDAHRAEAAERVDLAAIAARLRDDGAPCSPRDVVRLLHTWPHAGAGQPGPAPELKTEVRQGMLTWSVDGSMQALKDRLAARRVLASRAVSALLQRTQGAGSKLLVEHQLEDLAEWLHGDLFLRRTVTSPVEATRAAVAYAHEVGALQVISGLAVFRSAMRLERDPDWPKLDDQDAKRAIEALTEHQAQRVLRVHVIDTWARTMIDDRARADALRRDWFTLPLAAFTERWFPGQAKAIARPTTPESYARIVTALGDPKQKSVVTADPRRSHLVLAGPGSGKTRVLTHRIAWLLLVQRVRARRIAVVCYTRANAIELRRRLTELVGDAARGVKVRTLHGIALSLVGWGEGAASADLGSLIPRATALLASTAVDDESRARQREALLDGVQYLFVDEYQDIDGDGYALLSEMAGRRLPDDHHKLRVFAVGDDDQAIFGFSGAKVDFIRAFEADYKACPHALFASYRNPTAVLDLAQALVAPLPGRLKADVTLRVDAKRRRDPPMGPWAHDHADLRGRIPWYETDSVEGAARRAIEVTQAWIADGIDPASIAALTRSRPHGLNRLRVQAENLGVSFSWPLPRDEALPMLHIREVAAIADRLRDAREPLGATARPTRDGARSTGAEVRGDAVADWIDGLGHGDWADALRSWIAPNRARRWPAERWLSDLAMWARLERSARRIGRGVHLGTMHDAKGLEFDHVLLLDDGGHGDEDEQVRLLYVALTRARRSLQIFSTRRPSGPFAQLRSSVIERREVVALVGDAAAQPHDYGVIGRDDIFIDWLGRQGAAHPGHEAMARARVGDRFRLVEDGAWVRIVDAGGVDVGRLSAKGLALWRERVGRGLALRLIATVRERKEDPNRDEAYRERLMCATWWTGVWEGRWGG